MLDKKVKDLINTQINKEFYSAYLYLDFADYYYDKGLDGFGNWYDVQAQEERDHAMLMRKYLQNNGEAVTLDAVAGPDKTYAKLDDPLRFGLEHERYVTSLINTIYQMNTTSSAYNSVNISCNPSYIMVYTLYETIFE